MSTEPEGRPEGHSEGRPEGHSEGRPEGHSEGRPEGHSEGRPEGRPGLPMPADVLPHRAPFLFVDEVTAIEPGRRATGIWRLSGDEAFFAGHFPGRPTLPGVLMVEALAQLGGVAVLADPRFQGYLPLFGGIDKARFRRQVVPGETLELDVELDQLSTTAGRGHGTATVEGKVAASASMLFVLVRP